LRELLGPRHVSPMSPVPQFLHASKLGPSQSSTSTMALRSDASKTLIVVFNKPGFVRQAAKPLENSFSLLEDCQITHSKIYCKKTPR